MPGVKTGPCSRGARTLTVPPERAELDGGLGLKIATAVGYKGEVFSVSRTDIISRFEGPNGVT